ncbi:hypothetical protein ACW4FQ_27175, partial [Escherichia coli]
FGSVDRSRNTLQDPALKPPQKRCKLSGSKCPALGVAMRQNAIQEAALLSALFPLISDLAQDFLDVIGFSVGVCG